ncbi:MAG: DUF3090 family protein [Actinomycetota bacterium]|nr:DUF3090 family protein [Actinomycetota bacterium]
MPRQVFNFTEPERFVVGTVGMPGERTFFLQARQGNLITSVVIEKQQALVLAERTDQLLDEVRQTRAPLVDIPDGGGVGAVDVAPLELPIFEEFRVGAMALGWDEATAKVVIEAHAVTEEGGQVPEIADDDGEGVDTLRVWLSASQARGFAERTRAVVAAGRPPCPFCSQPLDPQGHICPRNNGYRRRA